LTSDNSPRREEIRSLLAENRRLLEALHSEMVGGFDSLHNGFDSLDARFDSLHNSLDAMQEEMRSGFDRIEQQLNELLGLAGDVKGKAQVLVDRRNTRSTEHL